MRLRIVDGEVQLDPDSLHLTDPQLEALATDREIAVTAGAGAGKTHTLATRYVALFLELAKRGSPDIDQVAVLTFTEKAAEEMAERCYTRLTGLSAACRLQREALDQLDGPSGAPLGGHLCTAIDRLTDRFDAARIGTFHGFCASVLREFPVETHTPLDALVLEPVEATSLAQRCLEDTLLERLTADPAGMGALLDAFGSRMRLVQAGETALSRRAELGQALRAHAAGQRTVADAVARASIPPEDVARWLTQVGRPVLHAVSQLAAPGGPTPFVQQVIRPALSALDGPVPADDLGRALHHNALYAACLDSLAVAPGRNRVLTHPSVIGTKATWVDAHRYAQAKAALGRLAERLEDWPIRAAVARELPTRADAALYEVLQPFSLWVLTAVERFRAELEAVGAVDFSEMQQRAVAAVNEHPDVRQALIRRHRYLVVDEFQDTDAGQWDLVRAIGRPQGLPSDRIFLVGDAKQAIYGFRGGDVTVFEAAQGELAAEPVDLPHNFRSRPELIDWFNRVFPHVLEGVSYAPILPGRAETGGTVTVVLGERDDEAGDPAATAHLIAAEILGDAAPWAELGLRDRQRHPSPPIAILLRRRTHMAAYEEALRERSVPYAVARGVGFWSRPEVVDLVNTLHGVVTGDAASVVGALRSPIFGLTDQAIADLGPRLRQIHTLDPRQFTGDTRFALAHWQVLRQRCRSAPPTEILRHLVDHARPLWHERSDLAPGRVEANGQRLIELAATMDAHGGVHRCARAFLAQVLAGTRESEAVLAPDAARVLLLTIHAAKGLEFPVVLVPEIDVPPRTDSGALAVGRPDGDWQMAFAVSDEEALVQQRVRPGMLHAVQRAARTEADAEYTRLLYVAATRARDHLVLLGNHPPQNPGVRASWVERLAPILPATTRSRDRQEVLALPLLEAGSPRRLPPPPAIPPALDSGHQVEISASGLDAFSACPARWYRRHRLGIPEHSRPVEERARQLAGLRGQVVHGLLEDRASEDASLARRRWTAAVVDAGLARADADNAVETLLQHLDTANRSPDLQRALGATGHSEVGFRTAHGTVALRGQIDRIYLENDGWVVLDYKTEHVRGPPSVAGHRRQLLAYAWAADRILQARGQPGVVRAEVLFTSTGHTVAIPWDQAARAELEALLERVADVAELPWADVERRAVADDAPRPCDGCGFRGRGCRGQERPEPALGGLGSS